MRSCVMYSERHSRSSVGVYTLTHTHACACAHTHTVDTAWSHIKGITWKRNVRERTVLFVKQVKIKPTLTDSRERPNFCCLLNISEPHDHC